MHHLVDDTPDYTGKHINTQNLDTFADYTESINEQINQTKGS